MTVTSIDELAERVAAEWSSAQRLLLDAARGAANESGIQKARGAMHDALTQLERVEDDQVKADQAVRALREAAVEARKSALGEITWERIERSGNKTLWVTDEDETEMVETPEGAVAKPTGRKVRRQVTADEGRELAATEAGRLPAVIEADTALRKAEDEALLARMAVERATRRYQAARYDVQAAGTYLAALTAAIGHEDFR